MPNHFLVFMGGTGAKCAEAFVHLAACGAIGDPATTFHLLTMDVDATNGNRALALEAIARYRLLKAQFPANGQFEGSSLFGPNIIHYDWHVKLPQDFPRAAGTNCLHAMRAQNNADEEALMRLFYTEEELGFDFSKEGFHAIPAIGAPVLQHILDSGGELDDFGAFADALRSEIGVNSRLIITGSIFGGTGASGIPAVTRALHDETRDIALAGNLLTSAVLLLPYYHFAEPSREDELGVHARRFYNNARGALAFYRDMEAELGYHSLYMIGSPLDYNMGPYRPGMEGQKNPPTPVEWEAALAIEHCLRTEPGEDGSKRHYLRAVRGASQGDGVRELQIGFEDFAVPIRNDVATMARFIAAYMGYYRNYIERHRGVTRGCKPFYEELIAPYLDRQEADHKAFAALEAFCARCWTWMRETFGYDLLRQSCFSGRMTGAGGYPVRSLHALIPGAPSPHWAQVEDAMFDGVRPASREDADYPQRCAGQFVHGLFAHCAP